MSVNGAPVDALLREVAAAGGSDLYVKPGSPAMVRVAGRLRPASPPLGPDDVRRLVAPLLGPGHEDALARTGRADLAYAVADAGRFRVNVYTQRGMTSFVARLVRDVIPTFEELHIPPIAGEMALRPRGFVLVVGAAGSGKSTTLAAMVDYRNRAVDGHIVTIEDPIEYLHRDHRSLVSQREVGTDTPSFSDGLRDALRQAPDVILIGEMRDAVSAEAALHFAETGHLVLSSMHSVNASQALERILHFFPALQHGDLLLQLSLNLVGILGQRLLPRADGDGLVPAVEVLVASPRVRDLVRKGDLLGLRAAVDAGDQAGMQTFDQSLFGWWQQGAIDQETALRHADSPSDLRMRMRGLR